MTLELPATLGVSPNVPRPWKLTLHPRELRRLPANSAFLRRKDYSEFTVISRCCFNSTFLSTCILLVLLDIHSFFTSTSLCSKAITFYEARMSDEEQNIRKGPNQPNTLVSSHTKLVSAESPICSLDISSNLHPGVQLWTCNRQTLKTC